MSTFRWAWRQLLADPLAPIILALASAVAAALAGAVPMVSADLANRQLHASLGGLSAQQGDVAGSWTAMVTEPGVAGLPDAWEAFREPATQITATLPPPLRDILGPPHFLASAPKVSFTPTTTDAYYRVTLHPFVDPDQLAHTRVVRGTWPALQAAGQPTQVAVLDEVATRLGWELGAEITDGYVLTGTYGVGDPDDPRWQQIPYESRFTEAADPNRGVELIAGVSLAPQALAPVSGQQPALVTFKVWFPVDRAGAGSGGVDVALLRSQLTGLLARRFPIVAEQAQPTLDAQDIRLTSDLNATLEAVIGQQRVAGAVLAVTAAGPLGVGLGLVLLAARLVVHRRRHALTLLLARGASREQLARWLALEGLALGIPAAALGLWLADLALPCRAGWPSWLAALVVGALPALALTWAARGIRDTVGRADLSPTSSRGRLVGEALLVLVAAAATWQLFSRPSLGDGGLDLLGAVSPVLLTGTVTVLALRLYPYPLRAFARLLRRSDLPAHLGVLRAVRDPAGGLLPVATVVLGTTMAVLGAGLLGTLSAGTRDAVWEDNGASIRISGPIITDELLVQIRATDGVAAAARIHSVGARRPLKTAETQTPVELWLADRDLLEAYRGSPVHPPISPDLFTDAEPPGLLVGGEVPVATGEADVQGVGGVRLLGRLPSLPGVRTTTAWAVADVEAWTRVVGPAPAAKLVLVAVEPGAPVDEVLQSLRNVVGASLMTSAADQLDSVTSSPVVAGLSRVFTALAALTGALLAAILAVGQLMGSGARARTVAILRTLGMPPGRARTLTAWELAPALLLALVVGTAAGLGLTQVVLATLDFGALTGGRGSPPLSVGVGPLATVYAILGGGLLLSAATSAAVTARTKLATELRRGDLR